MGDVGRVQAGREHRALVASREPETFEENSAVYEGEDLRRFRASRPTPERFRRNEEKHDALAKAFDVLSRDVVAIATKQDDIVSAVAEIKSDVKQVVSSNASMVGSFETYLAMQSQRPHQDSIMRVAQETAKTTTTVTLAERVLDQQSKGTEFKRSLVLKIVGGVISAGGLGALVHWLIGKL
jgi:hypothetical protein